MSMEWKPLETKITSPEKKSANEEVAMPVVETNQMEVTAENNKLEVTVEEVDDIMSQLDQEEGNLKAAGEKIIEKAPAEKKGRMKKVTTYVTAVLVGLTLFAADGTINKVQAGGRNDFGAILAESLAQGLGGATKNILRGVSQGISKGSSKTFERATTHGKDEKIAIQSYNARKRMIEMDKLRNVIDYNTYKFRMDDLDRDFAINHRN